MSDKERFQDILIDLQAIEDDLVANGAPAEAIQHVQFAAKICADEFRKRFG